MLKSKLISDFTTLVNKYDGSFTFKLNVLSLIDKFTQEFRKAEEESYRLRNKTNNESNFSDFSLNSPYFFNSDDSNSNDSDSSNSSDFSGDGGTFAGGGSSGEW